MQKNEKQQILQDQCPSVHIDEKIIYCQSEGQSESPTSISSSVTLGQFVKQNNKKIYKNKKKVNNKEVNKINLQLKWPPKDTLMFYKAIELAGLDFQMMQLIQPSRSRKQLINKYRKEEIFNKEKLKKCLEIHKDQTQSSYFKLNEFVESLKSSL